MQIKVQRHWCIDVRNTIAVAGDLHYTMLYIYTYDKQKIAEARFCIDTNQEKPLRNKVMIKVNLLQYTEKRRQHQLTIKLCYNLM